MPLPLLDSFRGVSLTAFLLALLLPGSVLAQGTGTVTGTDGKYTLRRVPEGPQTIVFRWLGYRPTEAQVTVEPGGSVTVDTGLEPVAVALTELVVEGAS